MHFPINDSPEAYDSPTSGFWLTGDSIGGSATPFDVDKITLNMRSNRIRDGDGGMAGLSRPERAWLSMIRDRRTFPRARSVHSAYLLVRVCSACGLTRSNPKSSHWSRFSPRLRLPYHHHHRCGIVATGLRDRCSHQCLGGIHAGRGLRVGSG